MDAMATCPRTLAMWGGMEMGKCRTLLIQGKARCLALYGTIKWKLNDILKPFKGIHTAKIMMG